MTDERRRPRRVAEIVQSLLAEALRREIDDPRLASLVITSVEVPDDLSVAHVQVRLLVGGDDQRARAAALRSLGRAGPRLRRGLGPALQLRRVPALSFSYDLGLDKARRVEELLDEIEREPKAKD
jgi:ribosome-binding factor A